VSQYPEAPSLEELKKLRKPIRNVNKEHREKLTRLQRFAIWITQHIGSMGFFLIIVGWTIVWLTWNILAPSGWCFDPYPGFILWLFISNMIQIFLMPLLLIGQNLQGMHAEVRAQADLETDVKAEREIEAILMHLERQNEMVLRILQHLEGEQTKITRTT
jgi:uncharacterized membrane protein